MYFLTFVLLFTLTILYISFRKRKNYKLPPGPPGLPILGNIHQLIGQNPFIKFSKWADQFGKMYTINLSTKPAIVINDPKLMREIFNTFQSTGKFQTDSILLVSEGPYGVLNSEGLVWSQQRKFCLKTLKKFGFGNKRMETLILSEANKTVQYITTQNKIFNLKPLQMQPIFLQSVLNTIWTMVASTTIELGDSTISQLLETISNTFEHAMKTGLTFLPWLKYIAPKLSGYTAHKKACLNVINWIKEEFLNHKKTFIEGSHKDVIDAFIEESGNDPIKSKHAIAGVVELFLASSFTTGSTLTWLLCYLSVNPEIQAKLQEEVDKVLEKNQEILLGHKSSMAYTEAVILETMRMSSFAPIGIPHQLLDDLEIHSYKFPKGLVLIPNIYHCHYNRNVWGDPENFRPQRFLGKQGEKLKEHVIPFQLGKRQCVGEPLAKDILFIFVTKLFQHFDVKPDENEEAANYYKPGDIGFNYMPPKLGLRITPRPKYNLGS